MGNDLPKADIYTMLSYADNDGTIGYAYIETACSPHVDLRVNIVEHRHSTLDTAGVSTTLRPDRQAFFSCTSMYLCMYMGTRTWHCWCMGMNSGCSFLAVNLNILKAILKFPPTTCFPDIPMHQQCHTWAQCQRVVSTFYVWIYCLKLNPMCAQLTSSGKYVPDHLKMPMSLKP